MNMATQVRYGRGKGYGWLPLLFGPVVGLAVVMGANSDGKMGLAVLCGLTGLATLMWVRSRWVLLGALLFFLPLTVDITFFHRQHGGSTSGLVISATDLCLFALAALCLYEMALKKARLKIAPRLLIPAAAFLAIGAIGMVSSEAPVFGMFELFRLTKAFLIILILPNVLRNEKDLKLALTVLFVGLALQAVLAGLQFRARGPLGLSFIGENPDLMLDRLGTTTEARPGGTLFHPNMLAIYLNLLLFIAIAIVLGLGLSAKTLPLVAVTAMGGLALILTLSRGGWVSFAIGFMVLAAALYCYVRRSRRAVGWTVAITAIVGLAAVLVPGSPVYNRLHRHDYGAGSLRFRAGRAAPAAVAAAPSRGYAVPPHAGDRAA